MDFLLDPYILAVPELSRGADPAREYLFSLQAWAAEVTAGAHKFWLSAPILESLCRVNQYPLYDQVKSLAQRIKHESKIFDANTAFRACEPILVSPPYIDDKLQNGYAIRVDEATTVIIPDVIANRLHPEVADALRETLARVGYAKEKHSQELAVSLLFATSALEGQDDTVGVEADIYAPDRSNRLKVETDWLLITSPSELGEIKKLETFWANIEQAVNWAYQDLCDCGVLDKEKHKLPNFAVGGRFSQCIQQQHWDKRPDYLAKVFRTAVKVLTGYWSRGTKKNHELRISSSNRRQRIRARDGATAWRAQVTRGRLAIRLHYWLTPDGVVELSTIGPHENYKIA